MGTEELEKLLAAMQRAAETVAAPNWADKLAAAASALAVIIAVWVAWRQNRIIIKQAEISEQQNKITLFEKRYDVYETTYKLVRAAKKLPAGVTADEIYAAFQDAFGQWPGVDQKSEEECREGLLMSIHEKLEPAQFLFADDVYQTILLFQTNLLLLIVTMRYHGDDADKLEKKRADFCRIAEEVESGGVLKKMEADLHLHSIKL